MAPIKRMIAGRMICLLTKTSNATNFTINPVVGGIPANASIIINRRILLVGPIDFKRDVFFCDREFSWDRRIIIGTIILIYTIKYRVAKGQDKGLTTNIQPICLIEEYASNGRN